MANVGYASIQIIPSVRGIGDELRRQLVGPSADAGQEAGTAAGEGMRDKVRAGAIAAGVAAGALLVAGISEAMEQSGITSTLKAQLGATGPQAAQYGKIAGRLYSQGITENFQQGADAIRAIVNAGLVPPDATNRQLESIAGKMTDVARTFGSDMSMQTQAVSAMLKNGLAPSAEAALDVITVGMQKLGPNAEDLLETFQEYSVQLKKLGLDSQTALGLFRQGLQGGARDTDIIADAFKEFSIRAIDMSDTSREAYKSLGLDAETMEAQISKGGKGAAQGLQTVLDKLRAMKDPVEQNAAAVGLFGTQAEDMGAALFALDPSKATQGIGKLGGAAHRLGKDLHSGPTHELEVFARSLKQGFIEFLGAQVLPVLKGTAAVINGSVLPPVRAVGGALADVLLPAMSGVADAGVGVVNWLRDMGTWLIPIGIALGGFTLALTAQAAATGGVAAVFAVYRAVILSWTLVQNGATLAMTAFNLVMNANPIILVITAIVALGAALVVAFQRVTWFRAAVMAAWQGIQTAVSFAWNSILRPALDGIWAGMQAVGAAAMWLWNNAIGPAFAGIWLAARVLLAVVLVAVITPIYLGMKLLGALAVWLWTSAIKPAFDGIAAGALWLWNSGIKPAFDGIAWLVRWLYTNVISPVAEGIKASWRAVGAAAMWLWRNAVLPAFDGIRMVIRLWWDGARATFTAVRTYIFGPLAAVFRWLYDNVIKPVWNGIKNSIRATWDSGIRPTFDALKRGVSAIGDSFKSGVGYIGRVWDGLKSVARRPVQFVIDTVYNNGIRTVWNKVAGLLDLGGLDPVRFATGGSVFGAGTATSDSIPALLSNGEHVWTAAEVQGAGGHGAVQALRARARHGGLPGFKDGGIVSDIWSGITGAAKTIGGWTGSAWDLITNPSEIWDKAIGPVRRKIDSIGGTRWASMIAQLPIRMIKGLKDKVVSAAKGLLDFGGGDIGGSGVQRWSGVVLQALRMVGQPASLLPVVLRRMNQESGGNPRAINLWDSNAQAGDPSRGLMQTIGSTFAAYAGPLRSRGIYDPLANIFASMRYALSRYGSLASAYNRPGGYDNGGWLMPGHSNTFNGTGRPEAVLTDPQWTAISTLAARGSEPVVVEVHTRDEALAGFIDVRVRKGNHELATTLRARRV